MKVELPVIYSQFDSRWANQLLGFNTDPKFNFYNFGCFVTSLASICRYYGFDENPFTFGEKLKKMGAGKGFQAGTGNYVYGAITKIHSEIKEKVIITSDVLTDGQIAEIKAAIDNGYPVIFQIDFNPKTVLLDSHFSIAVDYNPDNENDFSFADSLGGKVHSLKDYLGWFKPNARKTIEKYIIYTGPKPEVSPEMMLVPKNIWPKVVHGSTEWDKTVAEYLPQSDPVKTDFEGEGGVKKVISGFKSRTTDVENQLADVGKKMAILEQEIINQKDKLANVEADCQTKLKIANNAYEALKKTAPNVDKLRGEFEGIISDLQGKLREAQKQVGLRDIEIAEFKNGKITVSRIKGVANFLLDMIKKVYGKK